MPDGRSAYSHYLDNIRDTKINGKNLRQSIGALITSKAYLAAPEDPGTNDEESLRAQYISNIISMYRRKAKNELYQQSEQFANKAELKKDIRRQVRSGRRTTVEAIQSLLNPEIET